MDSGNSGSMQSSSDGGGDDQEYDSRAASISTYFNPPPPHHHNSTSPLPFDPNSLLNFDHPIYSTPPPTQPFLRPSPPPPHPSGHNTNTVTHTTTTTTATQRTYPDHCALRPRAANPKKKRSRASRRAPTTVLTTDTTNFRAMVQEFTGIPPPPFSSSSSPFMRSSPLDLFGTPSSIRSNPFLLRPFAQKLQPPLLSGNSASLGGAAVSYRVQNPVPSVGLDGFGPGHGLQNRENLFAGDGSERVSMGWAGAGVGPVDGADQSHLRLVNGNYDYSHGNGNLVNFAASSSDFRGEKASEKNCGKGERNVEPWICSLDQ